MAAPGVVIGFTWRKMATCCKVTMCNKVATSSKMVWRDSGGNGVARCGDRPVVNLVKWLSACSKVEGYL